jgi:hypothetical protein
MSSLRRGGLRFLAQFFHILVPRIAGDVIPVAVGDGNETVHGRVEIMTLREILERCSLLEVEESRHESETYSELVFYNKEIDEWLRILSEALGPPAKPPGNKPTKELERLTQEYGGILTDQTLFVREFDAVMVIAMFWPWGNGKYTTLKMAVLEKQEQEVTTSPKKARSSLLSALGKVLFHKPSQKPV